MKWNWEKPGWPNFTYDSVALEPLEKRFLLRSGEFIGAFRHIGAEDQDTIRIELIGDEAVKTSEIEGRDPQPRQRSIVAAPPAWAGSGKARHDTG